MSELLDGVNTLLMARGLSPVNQVISGHPLHATAIRLLERARESVSSRKWWFNTEKEYQLAVDPSTSKVVVPADVLRLDDCTYIIMDGYLYDPEEHTNIFDDAPDEVTLVYKRAWESLPVVAFNYIEAVAKEPFIRPLNDALKTKEAKTDINVALAFLQAEDLQHKDVNIASNPLVAKWKSKMLVR